MTSPSPIRSRTRKAIPASEEGYMMLVAMFLLALLVLSLAVAAPQVAKSIQRDRDLETFHRGMQYRRAIRLYYRKFHVYPPSVDALMRTDSIRFLRKRYTDPITGIDDWKPVLFGLNKTPTAMGFFGEPLSGMTIAGTGPGCSNGLGGMGSSGSSIFGNNNSTSGSSASGNSPTTSTGTSGTGCGPTDTSGGTNADDTESTTSGTGSSGTGTGTGAGTDAGPSGQTFGGAGIIGFSPASPKQSILVYKKKNHYKDWEFTYDPISEMRMRSGGDLGAIGQSAGSMTNPQGSNGLGTDQGGSSPGYPASGSPNPSSPSMPPETPAPQ